ncbi:MAG: sugar transferase [Melioribacteraceae bacterium]|nr:sugar transferase [Melioribacteraceae bacterium]
MLYFRTLGLSSLNKRFLDIFLSVLFIVLLSPLFFIISFVIWIDSGSPIFYLQERIGKDWKTFNIIKFRTMKNGSDKNGPAVSSDSDERVTKFGAFLRMWKLDEIPQLFNVLKGDMSFVGPRPEVKKFAEFYRDEYNLLLQVKPGISDFASINFRHEGKILNNVQNIEDVYIKEILPQKIELSKEYVSNHSLIMDLKILFLTIITLLK